MLNKKQSIRQKLMFYVTILATVCTMVILFSSITVSTMLSRSKLFFDCNQNLSDFYVNVTEMDSMARAFVYEKSPQNYTEYERLLKQAKENLIIIDKTVDNTTKWRISLLHNMLDYYRKPLNEYMSGVGSSYATYNMLLYRKNLIANTAPTYYAYLAEYMSDKTDSMQTKWQFQRNLQVGMLAGVVVFAVIMGRIYSKKIYMPIMAMVNNTKLLKKGTYTLQLVDTSLSEMDILSSSFGEMAASMQKNVGTLKENARLEYKLLKQENDNLEMKNLVTEAELHSLQAQINPHFLFNTLSMISKSAYIGGDTITSELMENLTEFLRYALDKANKNSTLFEEIDSIKSYLFIQQKRFLGRVSFEIDVAQDTPNIRMPAIVLQPLVENAILHGTSSMTKEAVITIRVFSRKNQIHIYVEDNGTGMMPEDLEQLISKLKFGLESSCQSKGNGIGLSNVYKRLQVYFSSNMQFNIESEVGCGTIVSIIIPTEESYQ